MLKNNKTKYTATGRISSSKPNVQNIPIRTETGKKISRIFILSDKKGNQDEKETFTHSKK